MDRFAANSLFMVSKKWLVEEKSISDATKKINFEQENKKCCSSKIMIKLNHPKPKLNHMSLLKSIFPFVYHVQSLILMCRGVHKWHNICPMVNYDFNLKSNSRYLELNERATKSVKGGRSGWGGQGFFFNEPSLRVCFFLLHFSDVTHYFFRLQISKKKKKK